MSLNRAASAPTRAEVPGRFQTARAAADHGRHQAERAAEAWGTAFLKKDSPPTTSMMPHREPNKNRRSQRLVFVSCMTTPFQSHEDLPRTGGCPSPGDRPAQDDFLQGPAGPRVERDVSAVDLEPEVRAHDRRAAADEAGDPGGVRRPEDRLFRVAPCLGHAPPGGPA